MSCGRIASDVQWRTSRQYRMTLSFTHGVNEFSQIQDGPKVRRQTAATHGVGLGESFEVGNPCPGTHRYAPVSTFLDRMNVSLATLHSSGQRARSGMRFSFVSFHTYAVFCVAQWYRTGHRKTGTRTGAGSSPLILIRTADTRSTFLLPCS